MHKLLTKAACLLSACLLSADYIQADSPIASDINLPIERLVGRPADMPFQTRIKSATAGLMTFDFGYCYEPYECVRMTLGKIQRQAIYIPAETVERYDGATLESIVVANGAIPCDSLSAFKISLYRDTADVEPFYTMDVNMPARKHLEWTAYPLSKPITIKKGEPFFVVNEFPVDLYPYNKEDVEDNYMPMTIDYMMCPDDLGYSDLYYYFGQVSKRYIWDNLGGMLGNSCIRLRISGDNLPKDDLGVSSLDVPARIRPEEDFTASVILTNWGANPVTNCDFEVVVGTGAPELNHIDFVNSDDQPESLQFHESYRVVFNSVSHEIGSDVPVTVTLKAVNGNTDIYESNNQTGTVTLSVPDDYGYRRALIAEEVTGTWCGWCPMGIVAFEQMRETDPDYFIPIAVHMDDAMSPVSGFDDVLKASGGSAPVMFINHDVAADKVLSPDPITVQQCYDYYTQFPAFANITIDVRNVTEDAVEFDANYEFYEDAANNYKMMYVITEDAVGPYTQRNYFSNDTQALGGWENLPTYVTTTFNDVARCRKDVSSKGILPDMIEGGIVYTDSRRMALPQIEDGINISNLNIIAVLLNTLTGQAENAAIARCGSYDSVTDVTVDNSNEPVELFDLQGRRIAADKAPAGIYIRRQGTQVSKITVR